MAEPEDMHGDPLYPPPPPVRPAASPVEPQPPAIENPQIVRAKPFWMPDTQGFLAIAIIFLIGMIVWVLLLRPPAIDERTSGVLMTIVGVLIACLKDVYSFFFGSSRGSEKKDDAIIKNALPVPVAPISIPPAVAPAQQ